VNKRVQTSTVDEPLVETVRRQRERADVRPKRQPRYNVVLWDDNDHSYEYVIAMMRALFGHPTEKAFHIAEIVDSRGRAICLTTTLEHAELKRDQIHAYGKDQLIARCAGSMSASIEPVPE
jgi:ATP-dependent Clp protease adaptor protein ClpS